MADHEHLGADPARQDQTPLLTSQACAIAGFTLAALAMTGQGAWTQLAQALFGSTFAPSALGRVLASGFAATLVVEGIAFWFARRALVDPAGHDTWSGHLARAAVLVVIVGATFSALAELASLVLQV